MSNGKKIEEQLREKLEEIGCEIITNPHYDTEHKIDFIINKFKGIEWHEPFGVQVTIKLNDVTKQMIFVKMQRERPLTPMSIYLELDGGIEIDRGGAAVVYAALVSFIFNRAYEKKEILGLRVARDLSFEFFDFEEQLKQKEEELRNNPPTGTLTGVIDLGHYDVHAGFGFIEYPDYWNFFFHVKASNIDRELKSELDSLDPNSNLLSKNPIPITFKFGGWDRNRRNPMATNIKRASTS